MVVIIDACSLVELARYYIPFDDEGVLSNFIQTKFAIKEFVLLDKIFDECKFVAKGLAVQALPFIAESQNITKTDTLIIHSPKKFQNLLDNQYCIQLVRNKLTDQEFSSYKEEYLKTGDAKVILYIDDLLYNGCKLDDIYCTPHF